MNSNRYRNTSILGAGLAVALVALANAAYAEGPRGGGGHPNQVFDSRYHHDHYYPARGQYYGSLPPAAVYVGHPGGGYYYRGGVWYRPYGARFVVVAPPFGVVVPFLPGFYTTLWFGGVPYYYANDSYYLWRPEAGGYVVTQPPSGVEPSTQAPPTAAATEPFIYPKNGQSEQQQATDRYECHRWAATEVSFDPTSPDDNAAAQQATAAREAYFRALTACLEGRGYSVK